MEGYNLEGQYQKSRVGKNKLGEISAMDPTMDAVHLWRQVSCKAIGPHYRWAPHKSKCLVGTIS